MAASTRPPPPRLETACLPFAPSLRGALAAAGFRTAADFDGLSAAEVARGRSGEDGGVRGRAPKRQHATIREPTRPCPLPAANITDADAAAALASLTSRAAPLAASLPGASSAAALLRRERAETRVVTFVADLDRVLGGGVAPGQMTEFCE